MPKFQTRTIVHVNTKDLFNLMQKKCKVIWGFSESLAECTQKITLSLSELLNTFYETPSELPMEIYNKWKKEEEILEKRIHVYKINREHIHFE